MKESCEIFNSTAEPSTHQSLVKMIKSNIPFIKTKLMLFIGFCLMISTSVKSQNDVFVTVEKMPRFSGCEHWADENKAYVCFGESMIKFIANELKYPKLAVEQGIEGRVFIGFIVDEMGFVTNVKVLRGGDKLLEDEAVRVVEKFPPFKPGEQDGQKVKVEFTVPINFKLQ